MRHYLILTESVDMPLTDATNVTIANVSGPMGRVYAMSQTEKGFVDSVEDAILKQRILDTMFEIPANSVPTVKAGIIRIELDGPGAVAVLSYSTKTAATIEPILPPGVSLSVEEMGHV